MANYIEQKTIQYIPLKKGAENLCNNNDIQTDNNINNEYNFFKKYIDFDDEHVKALNEGEKEKDRYSNIKCYNHNILKISTESKYINASPINILNEKYFICTQGPKNETIDDFWTMVWEHKCNVIVMLCNEIEAGKEKCAKYWDESKIQKNYKLLIAEDIIKKDYEIKEIFLYKIPFKYGKPIYQIHFTGWPDHGVPDFKDGKIFDVFIEIIKLVDKYKGIEPVIVHCSAGVGRTGTFVSMYYLGKEILILL